MLCYESDIISIGEHPSAVASEKNHYMFQVPSSCVYYLGLVRPNEAENDEKVPGNLARFTPREPHRLEFCTTLLAPRLLKLLPLPSVVF